MLKWIGYTLYMILVFFLTLMIDQAAGMSKYQEFHKDEMKPYINEDVDAYLLGVQTILQTDYISLTPIYEQHISSGDYQLSIGVYPFGVTSGDTSRSGFILLVNNVEIYHQHTGETMSTLVEDPVLRISVVLDEETFDINGTTSKRANVYYRDSLVFTPTNVPFFVFLDGEGTNYDTENETYANIEKIIVSYSVGEIVNEDYIFYDFFVASKVTHEPAVQGNQKFDQPGDFTLENSDYRLNEQFAGDTPTEQEIIDFNLLLERGSLSAYNYLVWRAYIFYFLGVAVVTYFLFFHRKVMEKRRNKRSQLIQEKREQSQETVDAIFKDVEPKDDNTKKKR